MVFLSSRVGLCDRHLCLGARDISQAESIASLGHPIQYCDRTQTALRYDGTAHAVVVVDHIVFRIATLQR